MTVGQADFWVRLLPSCRWSMGLLRMDYLLNPKFVLLGFRGTGAELCYTSGLRYEMSTLSRKLSPQASSLFLLLTASLTMYLSSPSDVTIPQSQIPASPFQPLTQLTCFALIVTFRWLQVNKYYSMLDQCPSLALFSCPASCIRVFGRKHMNKTTSPPSTCHQEIYTVTISMVYLCNLENKLVVFWIIGNFCPNCWQCCGHVTCLRAHAWEPAETQGSILFNLAVMCTGPPKMLNQRHVTFGTTRPWLVTSEPYHCECDIDIQWFVVWWLQLLVDWQVYICSSKLSECHAQTCSHRWHTFLWLE